MNNNYYENTIANFISCSIPNRDCDYISYSGSMYWYESDGFIIRYSAHWGKVSTCRWKLDGKSKNIVGCGKAIRFEKIYTRNSVDEYNKWRDSLSYIQELLIFGSKVGEYFNLLKNLRLELSKHSDYCQGGRDAIQRINFRISEIKNHIKNKLKCE